MCQCQLLLDVREKKNVSLCIRSFGINRIILHFIYEPESNRNLCTCIFCGEEWNIPRQKSRQTEFIEIMMPLLMKFRSLSFLSCGIARNVCVCA